MTHNANTAIIRVNIVGHYIEIANCIFINYKAIVYSDWRVVDWQYININCALVIETTIKGFINDHICAKEIRGWLVNNTIANQKGCAVCRPRDD